MQRLGLPALARDGIIQLPECKIDVLAFLGRHERVLLPEGVSASDSLISERKEAQ